MNVEEHITLAVALLGKLGPGAGGGPGPEPEAAEGGDLDEEREVDDD